MTFRAVIWAAVSSEQQAADDKISIEEQERACRAWAQQHDYQVATVFRWDGYSRWESDILTALDDFAAQGRHEYHQLRDLWIRRAFDVLIVYVHTRLARSNTLYSFVIENVVRSGARIYSLSDGWITEDNVSQFLAIGGFSTASEVRSLVKRMKMGMRNRAQRGLLTSSIPPFSHQLVRDEKGKAIRTVVRAELRRLFDDLATLVLEGVPWEFVERDLYARFGHAAENGKPYPPLKFYFLMHMPVFWGHVAYSRWSRSHQDWCIEPGHTIPDGVTIYYDVHEPVYTGDLATQIKAELRRRRDLKGRAHPTSTRMFTGLFICDECRRTLCYEDQRLRRATVLKLRCLSPTVRRPNYPACSNRKRLFEAYARDYLSVLLHKMIDAADPAFFTRRDADNGTAARARAETLRAEVARLDKRVDALIIQRADAADPDLERRYYDQLAETNQQLKTVQRQLAEAEQHVRSTEVSRDQQLAYEEIAHLTVEKFWEQEPRFINQILRRLMGRSRLSVRDGLIVDVADALPHPKSKNNHA